MSRTRWSSQRFTRWQSESSSRSQWLLSPRRNGARRAFMRESKTTGAPSIRSPGQWSIRSRGRRASLPLQARQLGAEAGRQLDRRWDCLARIRVGYPCENGRAMSAGHSHSSAHYGNKDAVRAVVVSGVALGIAALVEIIAAVASRSASILADGLHNSGDVLTTFILLFTFALVRDQQPGASRPAMGDSRKLPPY